MSSETASELQIWPRKSAPIPIPSAIVRWTQGSAFDVQFQELPIHESRSLTCLLRSLTPSSSRLVVEPLTTPILVIGVPGGTLAGSRNAFRTARKRPLERRRSVLEGPSASVGSSKISISIWSFVRLALITPPPSRDTWHAIITRPSGVRLECVRGVDQGHNRPKWVSPSSPYRRYA